MSQPGWGKEAEAVCATLQKNEVVMKSFACHTHCSDTYFLFPILTWHGAASTVWTTFKTCKHTCQDHLILEGSGKGSNSTFRKASAAWILFVSPATVLSWKKWSEFIQFLHFIFEKYGVFFSKWPANPQQRDRSSPGLAKVVNINNTHQKSHAFCPKNGAINFLRNDTGRVCRLFSPIFGVPHTPDGFASHVFGLFGLPGTLPFHPRPGVFVRFFSHF